MSGWCPSSSVCGMAAVCAAAVLPGAVVRLVPYSSHCSTHQYCCHVVHCYLPGVLCVGGGCVSVVDVWWGILCPFPPCRGGGWGRRGWWGAVVDGGWHGEGRAVVLLTPRRMLASPSVCWRPPCRLPCGLIEWRGWCVACCPRVRIGSGTLRCLFPFTLSVPLLCCVAVFVVGGEVRWGDCVLLSSSVLCSLSQHCWFSAVSL